MKKILVTLLCFLLLIPLTGAAAPSPTVQTLIWCEPEIPFKVLDKIDFELYIQDYALIEALQITLDEPHEQIVWHLPVEITPEDQVKVAIINEDLYLDDTLITDDGNIIIDFSAIEPGTYYLYFYLKRGCE